MELFIFARFHARSGGEADLEAAIREVMAPTRAESGCLEYHYFRSLRDAGLFYIHSRWRDEAAFERHAEQPHTARFIARAEGLVDQPVEVTRAAMGA
jgi:quinol monooxygenase YgiN